MARKSRNPARKNQHDTPPKAEVRIDGAHSLGAPEAPSSSAVAAVESPPTMVEQVAAPLPIVTEPGTPAAIAQIRSQAQQLAQYLRNRQRDLDQREAEFNCRLAQLDNEARACRLALAERQAELDERESRLAEREQAIQRASQPMETERGPAVARQPDPAPGPQQLESLRQQFQQQSDQLQAQAEALRQAQERMDRQQQQGADALLFERQRFEQQQAEATEMTRRLLEMIERRREAVEAESERLAANAGRPSPELLAREECIQESARLLLSRQEQIQQGETLLAKAREEVETLRRQLSEDRRELHEQVRRERLRMAAEHRRSATELEKNRAALARRSEQLDRSQAAMAQLRAELDAMHREALEIRLATEELWMQLSGAAPPAALVRSLGQLRTRLADHYRGTAAEVQRQKRDLDSIRTELAAQHSALVQQRRDFEQWARDRQEELNQQADLLAQREKELSRSQSEHREAAEQWQLREIEYLEEIRQLRAEQPFLPALASA